MLQKEILEVKEIVRAHQGNESRVENCAQQILFQNFLIMEALIEFNNYRILILSFCQLHRLIRILNIL